MIGDKSEEKEDRDQRQHQPQKHVQGAAARRRKGNRNGLHERDASAPWPPRTDANEPSGRTEKSQSSLYYLFAEAVSGQNEAGGTFQRRGIIEAQKRRDSAT